MDEKRLAHLRRIAPLGGKARAARLSPERRREIARMGFQAMVARRFGGDREAALEWLTARLNFVHDPCPWNGVYRDPGPMPPPRPSQDDQTEPPERPEPHQQQEEEPESDLPF